MTRIVVLDRSPVHQATIRQIFAAADDADRPDIDFRQTGSDVLQQLQQHETAVLLTDLMLADMPGLEFLEQVCRQYPAVAVIVLTAPENEQIAVQAIRSGAASYIPTRLLQQELLDTVHSVLALANHKRDRGRIIECVARWSTDFQLGNDRTLIPPLVGYLQDVSQQIGLVADDSECMRIGVALEEALLNAIYHGNLEIESRLREEDDASFYQQVESRRTQAPYCERKLHVHVELTRQHGRFVIRDEGPGFDVSTVPDPTDPVNVDRVCGRGLLLMRTFMHEVSFNEAGNEVTLIKTRSPS